METMTKSEFASFLNRSCFESEIAFEVILNKCRIRGIKRNKVIGPFIVDYLLKVSRKKRLAIEIDGSFHRGRKVQDEIRQDILTNRYNVQVIRVSYPFGPDLFGALREIINWYSPKWKNREFALSRISAWEMNPGMFFAHCSHAKETGKRLRKNAR